MTAQERRLFLLNTLGAGVVVASCGRPHQGESTKTSGGDENDVTPTEDLMREHGVLNRILLIYEECATRLDEHKALAVDALAKSADIIHDFVEQYHEKLEEDYVFPRFEKANKLVDLVNTLRRQHLAGRALTDSIRQQTNATAIANDVDRKQLASNLRAFVRMYRPHEAREDTVLFPSFRAVISSKEMRDLGEQFEDKEHALFGKEGFEGIVRQVEAIERQLGVYELDQFTPR